MGLKGGQKLAMELLREVLRHWNDHGEPMGLSNLQNRYSNHYAKLKLDTFFAGYVEALADAGIFYVFRNKSAKRWVFVRDVWDVLSDTDKAKWRDRCSDHSDPMYLDSLPSHRRRSV